MGIMYAMRCDLCGETQVKEKPHEIRGKTYQADGQTKFACGPCDGKLKAAIELGSKGLDDPLKSVAGLLKGRDEQIRNLELATAAKRGDLTGAADELRRRRQGGGFIPVAGLDFESQYRENRSIPGAGPSHALPAPKGKTKKRKK